MKTPTSDSACVYVGISASLPNGKAREMRWSIAVPPGAAEEDGDPVMAALDQAVAVIREAWNNNKEGP